MLSAHTRLVPAVRRADTRAKTEPRPRAGTEPLESTSPYPRNFEAQNEGRESLPYLELEIDTEPQDVLPPREDKRPQLRIVKTVSRKIGVGTGPEDALSPASKAVDPEAPTEAIAKLDPDDRPTNAIAKQTVDVLEELATETFEKQRARPDSETEPNGPRPRPSRLQWLGVVVSKPEVGAALMIGTWLRPEFCVTSPITHVLPRGDGMLVQTTTKSRYFVGPDGDTYLVHKSSQGTST